MLDPPSPDGVVQAFLRSSMVNSDASSDLATADEDPWLRCDLATVLRPLIGPVFQQACGCSEKQEPPSHPTHQALHHRLRGTVAAGHRLLLNGFLLAHDFSPRVKST